MSETKVYIFYNSIHCTAVLLHTLYLTSATVIMLLKANERPKQIAKVESWNGCGGMHLKGGQQNGTS